LHLLLVATQGGDEKRVEPDPPAAASCLGRRLAGVASVHFQGALGHLDTRMGGVDVHEGPPEPGKLAGAQPAHEPGEPHGRPAVSWDGVDQKALRLLDGERLAGLGRAGHGQEHLGGRVRLDHPLVHRPLARLVQIQPGPVDGAGRVPLPRHPREEFLEAGGTGPVHPLASDSRPDV
jgi:hypothetical protein